MNETETSKLKHTRKKGPGLEQTLLIVFALAVAAIATFAMNNLIPETGLAAMVKALVIGAMAGLVSYAVNRFAIEKGAPLAARGYWAAFIASILSIAIIGGGLFASTYAGMTISSVDELRLHEYAQAKKSFIDASDAAVTQSLRAKPIINAISNDLKDKVACEISTACISNRGGGRGTVTRALELSSSRADQIALQMDKGDQSRQAINKQLHELMGKFQTVLGDEGRSLKDRRQELLRIDAQIDQQVNELGEAIPTALLQAYAAELGAGVDIAGRPQVTNTLNAILGNHARSLNTALESIEGSKAVAPVFPAKAGVSATFAYIGHFLPIAAIVAVVELILPLILWIYAFLKLSWDIENEEDRRAKADAAQMPKPTLEEDSDAQPWVNDPVPLHGKTFLNGSGSGKPRVTRRPGKDRNSSLGR